MLKIGQELLEESKKNTLSGDKTSGSGRDLLSLLVKANATPDLQRSQRLEDQDVVARECIES